MDKNIVEEMKKIVKGKIALEEKLAPHTSFKIGGPAEIWFEPSDLKDLQAGAEFAYSKKIPLYIVGSGTNLLVSDGGIKGVVIHLGSPYFKKYTVDGTSVTVGAGYNVSLLARQCSDKGLGGLESLVGIPGSVGGAVFMNAGGWTNPIYKNISEYLVSLKAIDMSGRIKTFNKEDIEFGYRRSNLEGYIIYEANFLLIKGDRDALMSMCSKFLNLKREKQVLDKYSAGCVFKNPSDCQFTSGQMIDMLGLKGFSVGGAEISSKHANFIINKNSATCADVVSLINIVKDKVKENYNVNLELEVTVI